MLDNVSLRLGARWVLARISAEFPTGTATMLTGGNGAGKTTLLRVIATALRPTRGSVKIFGQVATPTTLATVRRHVGLATHQSHLYDDLTAHENLRFVARASGSDAGRIDEVLATVGLTPHAQRSVRGFSAGMKRRVGLAKLLLRRPPLVLLDEPFGQLDTEGIALMERVIADFHAQGATLVVATHQHERGARLCDRRLTLHQGRLQTGAAP